MDLYGLLRMVAALALTVGLIVGLAFLARRYGLARTGPQAGARRLAITDQLWLDAGRTRLLLVRHDDSEHLIVVTPGGAQPIASGPARADLADAASPPPVPPLSFPFFGPKP